MIILIMVSVYIFEKVNELGSLDYRVTHILGKGRPHNALINSWLECKRSARLPSNNL